MKPDWPAEPTFSILTLPMGALRATPLYVLYCKARIFSFTDMLPVNVFMFILYSSFTQLSDRGSSSDLSSIKTEPQAPAWVIVCAATDCEKAHTHLTKLC